MSNRKDLKDVWVDIPNIWSFKEINWQKNIEILEIYWAQIISNKNRTQMDLHHPCKLRIDTSTPSVAQNWPEFSNPIMKRERDSRFRSYQIIKVRERQSSMQYPLLGFMENYLWRKVVVQRQVICMYNLC